MNAFDTNVLLYAIDEIDPFNHEVAVRLLDQLRAEANPPVLLWQVLCEFLAGLRRRENAGDLDRDDVQRALQTILVTYPLALPSPPVIDTACALFSRYSLSHWDSLLLGACIHAGVTTLFSEDMDGGMTYETVTVVNPFPTRP